MRQKSEMRSYQNRIATALYESDEKIAVARPGGGKTVAALTAIQELLRDKHIRHALVIAPKRVARMVWPDEIALWAHTAGLSYQVLTGTPQQRSIGLAEAHAGVYDITIVGIDIVEWLVRPWSSCRRIRGCSTYWSSTKCRGCVTLPGCGRVGCCATPNAGAWSGA